MPVELGGSGTVAENQEQQTEELQGIRAEQATAAKQDEQTGHLETVTGTVGTFKAPGDASAIAVDIARAPTLITQPAPEFAASATPASNAQRIVVGVVDLAPAEPVGEEGSANPVFVKGVAQISGEVSQGRGLSPDTSDPWIVKTSDGIDAKEIATKEGQDAGLAAVDDLEEDADATRIAAEELNTKTLTPLGTAPLDPVRGSASNVATQLGSLATPRGFTLDNIDATNDLYWGTGVGLTTANGYKIEPGYGFEFALPNTDLVWVIADSSADYQIGAIA